MIKLLIRPYCDNTEAGKKQRVLGPVNFLSLISRLKLLYAGNRIFKYADDCCLMIPASNIDTTDAELEHIAEWVRN